jgi:hypothetical protein
MRKYKISVDKINNQLNIRMWGILELEDINGFVEELKKEVDTIRATAFGLVFDVRELKVLKPEILPLAEVYLKMYKNYKFIGVTVEVGDNLTLKMQLGRIAKNVGVNSKLVQSNIISRKVS